MADGLTTDRIRNVALVGHSGAGTTTLVESSLLAAGAIGRAGRVEDGTTVADVDAEEHTRGVSLGLSVVSLDWATYRINLIDTPGDPDFEGPMRAALSVADLAVLVVSAVDGVEVGTERAWRRCAEIGMPVLVFVNKLDRERASFDRTLAQLREHFGDTIEPLELPIGAEASFHGLADVLTETAYIYEGHGSTSTRVTMPADLAEREHALHDEVVEAIVVGDDALLERFLDGDEPDLDELERTLEREVVERAAFPVLEGSAMTGVGVDRFLDYICEIGPPPSDDDRLPPPDPTAGASVLVFDTVADPYVGQISLFRVLSGTVRGDDHLVNARTGADERFHGIARVTASGQQQVDAIVAGDIGACAKLSDTGTGDVLAASGTAPPAVDPVEWPAAVHSIAVRARTQADDDKLSTALHRLMVEDPALRLDQDDETHQTILRGTGDIHLQVALERLQRKFGVAVDTEPLRVAYRETISLPAEAEGRHKKQSGGHGQFAVAAIRVEPTEPGSGFEMVDEVVGGAIPRQFIPAVERGISDTMNEGGVLRGYPVVDVRVRLVDGKHHSVDSSEMAFRAAGRVAFREAMASAEPVLLEPVSEMIVVVPTDLQGDVMGDLSSRRGHVTGTDQLGGEVAITAVVPTAEILRYASELRSLSGARGRFSARHHGYEPVPVNMVDRIEPREVVG